jgi:ribosomal protein S27AE
MVKCPDCGQLWEKTSKRRSNRCAPCRSIFEKAYRARRKAEGRPIVSTKMPREYHVEYEKAYYSRPEIKIHRAALQRSYVRDPERRVRHEARWKVRRALLAGRLKRRPCEVCGETRVDAHHDDYTKPLDVRWLCRRHHFEHHSKTGG